MSTSAMKSVISRIANGALTKAYFVIQHPTTEKYVLHPTADNMSCVGILDDAADAAGDHVAVHIDGGTTYAIAEGSITLGNLLIAKSGGKVATCAGTTGTWNIVAEALEGAANGERVSIRLRFEKFYVA